VIQKWGKEGIFAAQIQLSLNCSLSKLAFRSINLLAIITIAFAFIPGIGQSQILDQPPANDNFSNAIPLTGYSLSVTSLNTWATSEPGEPAHEGHPATRSTWWRWVAPENGVAQLNSMFTFATGSVVFLPLDPVYVGVYTGNELTNLVSVPFLPGSSLNSGNTVPSYKPTTYVFQVTAGETYYFAADTISPYTCSLTLTFGNLELTQPTILANLTPNQPVILEFAPVDTNIAIATLQAFVGTNELPLLTNNPYRFFYVAEREGTVPVWAFGTNTAGQALMSLTNYLTFRPSNDNFADATVISNDFPDSFLTDVELATSEPGESNLIPGLSFYPHTVWWKWTPLYSVPTEFKLTSLGSLLLIFRGTALTNLQLIGTLNSALIFWGNNPAITFTPEVGDTYYILGDSLQSFYIIGDDSPTLSWSFAPHTLELTPAGTQQGITDVPIEFEASWIESNSPSSSVDFVIGQKPPWILGLPPEIGEIGLAGSSSSPPYRATWIPTNVGTYYIWARCTNAFGALRESLKTTFQILFANDNFAGATVIPSNAKNARYNFSDVGATIEPGEPGHLNYSPAATRWWKWTPSYSGTVRLKATRELQAVPLEIYIGNSLANLQTIASNFRRTYRLGISGALTVPVRAHTTYFIRVDDLYPDLHQPTIPPSNITLTLEPGTNAPHAEILLSLLKNSPAGPIPFSRIFMPDGSPVNSLAFRAQLYVGTTATSLKPVGPAQPFRDPSSGYATYGAGVPWPIPVIIPNVKAYSPLFVQVRVWDSDTGASFETAQAAGGLTGKSKVLRIIAGSEDAGPARLTGIGNFKLHGPD
jgi:hypothetical protein